jgi:transposase, IS30 family
MKYIHITEAEQRRIERLLEAGESFRSISKKLGRSVSSISDEIKRNQVKGIYVARKAKHKARLRRQKSKIQCLKVSMNKELKDFVLEGLKEDQSPEGLSGRLKYVVKDKEYASTKAIYKFIYSPYGRQVEKHLYSKAVKRNGGRKRGQSSVWDDGRISIEQRPKKVEKRLEFGHFEGDFIESGRDGKGSLLVLVERKTRYPFLHYLEDRRTENINQIIGELLRDISLKSLTLDNDLSFQKHEQLSELIKATVFFCHPYCSQEKGTVENRNKAIRRYAPKRTDFSTVPLKRIKEIEQILRQKYMKCLSFKSPQEAWEKEIQRIEAQQKETKKTPAGVRMVDILKVKSVRLQG